MKYKEDLEGLDEKVKQYFEKVHGFQFDDEIKKLQEEIEEKPRGSPG